MQRGLKISEELVRRFPETLNYQYVLGWCQQYLARIIGGDSHFSDAEQLIRQSEIIFHRLSKLEPDNCDYRFGLASSLRCVGLIHLEMGHFDRADAELRESTELCVPIENDLFRETRGKIDYATILQDRGVVLLQMRESNEAELWLRRSVDILTAIVDGFPGSDWACAELCRSQTWLADSLVAQGRIVDAESVYRQAVVNWNRHILQGRCLGEQAWTRDHLGQLLWHNGNVDESRTEFRAALSLAEQAGDHILLASSYANCPETSLRSPEQAVAHAQLVSERDMRRWRLLGVAYYRTGDYEAAADALRKMVEQPIGDSFDSFFLAMSYSHLDEPAAAARWYDNGLSRINRPSLTEIDRIEAAHVEATQEVGSRQGDVNLQN
jgi:tetratricopeptide (TPR) repeat protein